MIGRGEHQPRHACFCTGLAEFRGHIKGSARIFPRGVRIGILRGQMNDRVNARKRVREVPALEDQPELGTSARHAARGRPRPGRSHESRRFRAPPERPAISLRPILPFAPVIATRSAALLSIIPSWPATDDSHATAVALDFSQHAVSHDDQVRRSRGSCGCGVTGSNGGENRCMIGMDVGSSLNHPDIVSAHDVQMNIQALVALCHPGCCRRS